MSKIDRPFRLWAISCAHVGSDLRRGPSPRESLAEAIRQSEYGGDEGGPGFEWDIAVNMGDLSGALRDTPDDEEGKEVVRQYGALRKHRREDMYDICGNHDRNATWQPEGEWFQKWADPVGVNTEFSGVDPERRPYPVYGTWERYEFRVGNLLFLMMSDRNEPTRKIGREVLGGNPGGVVTGETYRWWVRRVEANRDVLILTAHHYMLRDTTVASGRWEGVKMDQKLTASEGANREEAARTRARYHGAPRLGTPQGASYLYWVDSIPDAGLFERYLEEHPGAINLWLGGHTHTHPDDTYGGKSHIERKWGVNFINVAQLSRYHVGPERCIPPMSRLLTFTPGSDEVKVQCYLHASDHAPQGWYEKAERTLKLSKAFRWWDRENEIQ